MNRHLRSVIVTMMITAVFLTLSACTTAGEPAAETAGQAAFVDSASVSEQLGHQYATAAGHYPDSCARVSDVQQSVDGNAITIMLYVDSPDDMMCAQMLTPFEVNILLETGGLAPGEYTVTVNETAPASFTIGG